MFENINFDVQKYNKCENKFSKSTKKTTEHRPGTAVWSLLC